MMREAAIAAVILSLGGATATAEEPAETGWSVEASFEQGRVLRRAVPGSSTLFIQARGVIRAPPWAVRQVVLAPSSYDGVMAHLAEEKVLEAENCEPGARALPGCRRVWVYNRVSPPVVHDRDYTLRVELVQDALDAGGQFQQTWALDSDHGPPPRKGIIRMVANEGGWALRPDPAGTAFVYWISTDPGGAVPGWALKLSTGREVPRMVGAVEGAAKKLASNLEPPKPEPAASRSGPLDAGE